VESEHRSKKLITGLRLDRLEPGLARQAYAKDCDFCRQYWHYPDTWKHEKDRGQPVLGRRGQLQPWPDGTGPDCGKCVKPAAWTDRNRRRVARARVWQAVRGDPAVLTALGWGLADRTDPHLLEAVLILEEEERALTGELQARAAASLLVGLLGA